MKRSQVRDWITVGGTALTLLVNTAVFAGFGVLGWWLSNAVERGVQVYGGVAGILGAALCFLWLLALLGSMAVVMVGMPKLLHWLTEKLELVTREDL